MELIREYNSIALATGGLMAIYGLYMVSTAGKNREKRVKGYIEAVMGVIVFAVALLVK